MVLSSFCMLTISKIFHCARLWQLNKKLVTFFLSVQLIIQKTEIIFFNHQTMQMSIWGFNQEQLYILPSPSTALKSTMARLLSQTLYSSPAVIRNAWHYISQFNQIEIVGNKEDKGRGMNFQHESTAIPLKGSTDFLQGSPCEVFLQLHALAVYSV